MMGFRTVVSQLMTEVQEYLNCSLTHSELLRIASYESHRGGEAKQVFAALRDLPFIRRT